MLRQKLDIWGFTGSLVLVSEATLQHPNRLDRLLPIFLWATTEFSNNFNKKIWKPLKKDVILYRLSSAIILVSNTALACMTDDILGFVITSSDHDKWARGLCKCLSRQQDELPSGMTCKHFSFPAIRKRASDWGRLVGRESHLLVLLTEEVNNRLK